MTTFKLFNFCGDIIRGATISFLDPSDEHLTLARDDIHVIVGEVTPHLTYFAFQLHPVAFNDLAMHEGFHVAYGRARRERVSQPADHAGEGTVCDHARRSARRMALEVADQSVGQRRRITNGRIGQKLSRIRQTLKERAERGASDELCTLRDARARLDIRAEQLATDWAGQERFAVNQSGFRPWITRTSTTITASTRSTCTNPPMVLAVTMPRTQSTRRMMAIFMSMVCSPSTMRGRYGRS
jgi:hypothetical protein